ncbi:MAG: hypothetical protein M3Q80_00260 [bacterium]|nr:hypothetical protein [bacterium]
MLTAFPSLLAFDQISPLLIRIVLGTTLAHFGYKKMKEQGQVSGSNSKIYGVVEIIIAAFLIVGLFTQLAAILNAFILVVKLGHKGREGALFSDGINYYVLLLTMAVSLIFTGAGYYALDIILTK